ncbi:MAG: hypothetical protein ACFFCI_10205 [Promethearchaeota archaeon]
MFDSTERDNRKISCHHVFGWFVIMLVEFWVFWVNVLPYYIRSGLFLVGISGGLNVVLMFYELISLIIRMRRVQNNTKLFNTDNREEKLKQILEQNKERITFESK